MKKKKIIKSKGVGLSDLPERDFTRKILIDYLYGLTDWSKQMRVERKRSDKVE